MSITLLDNLDKEELKVLIANKLDTSVFEEYTGNITNSIEPAEDDIPTLFINGAIPSTKTEVLAELIYISKTDEFHSYIKIKCQGTSSLSYPKKNFTIKLYEDEEYSTKLKKDFKGWGKQNKFCLKANWIDLTHARNIVSARIWSDMVKTRSDYDSLPEELRSSPNQGAIDGFPVRVFCNGLYWGRYTLNIPKDKWMSNMDDDLETHCILCSENYVSGCFREAALIDETDWTDELHDEVPDSILTSWNNVIDFVMNSADDDFIANIETYFNLNSLIDYYCLSYVACHLDGLGKNQLFFTYDGTQWIASVYDLDSTWGLYWDGASFVSTSYKMQSEYETGVHGTSNLLYDRLEALFLDKIKERWLELRENVLTARNIINHFEEFCNLASNDLIAEDYSIYTGEGAFTAIPSQNTNILGQIRQYAVKRLSYVDSILQAITGEILLKENYSPEGNSWIDTSYINFNNGDYIEVSIDLSTCENNDIGLENILSVGNNIESWLQTIAGYHLYYSANTQSLEINSMLPSTNSSRTTITLTDNILVIKIDANGLYVNETLTATNSNLTSLSEVQIGSAEGIIRSNATYNYIKVVRF